MRGVFRIVGLAIALSGGASAQGLVEPPFGLRWGDTPQKLIDWATRHSLDRNVFAPGDQPALTVLRIQPRKGFLPDTQAGAVEGRFLGGKLFELTVQYFDPEASSEQMTLRFEDLKKQITTDQGALVPDQVQRVVEDQFVTRNQSFHREPVKGLFILLAFTEVEDLLRKKTESRFSLIYRNDNLKAEVQQALAHPEATK